MAFSSTWNALQKHLAVGTRIPNWTAANGLVGDDFTVVALENTHIDIGTVGAENLQAVPRGDFEIVYCLWNGYVQHRTKRHEIRDRTRFSKYIISILHWLEIKTGGQLP